MCHRIGLPPTFTIALGMSSLTSRIRKPRPPHKMMHFIRQPQFSVQAYSNPTEYSSHRSDQTSASLLSSSPDRKLSIATVPCKLRKAVVGLCELMLPDEDNHCIVRELRPSLRSFQASRMGKLFPEVQRQLFRIYNRLEVFLPPCWPSTTERNLLSAYSAAAFLFGCSQGNKKARLRKVRHTFSYQADDVPKLPSGHVLNNLWTATIH